MKHQPKMIRGFFIDPYKREVHKAEFGCDLQTWYQMLRCDCVGVTRLYASENNPHALDLWYDDEFLLKEPIGPGFRIEVNKEQQVFHGYGFVAASNPEGDTISLAPEGMRASNNQILSFLKIQWEIWEKRLDPNSFLDQRLRTIELELPGRFKFVDLPVDNPERN